LSEEVGPLLTLEWISNQPLDILHDDVRTILNMVVLAQNQITLKINVFKLQQYLIKTLDVEIAAPPLKEMNIDIPYKTKHANNGAVIVQASNNDKDMLDTPNDQLARIVKGIVWRDEHFAGETLRDIAKRNNYGENYINKCIQDSFSFLSV